MNETRKDLENGDFEFVSVPITLIRAAQDVCQAMSGSQDQILKIARLREEGKKWNNTDNIVRKND